MRPKNGLSHLLTNALADLKRNKVRTFLTSLGIMIGVFSVVMLIALGLGLKNYIQNQFDKLGRLFVSRQDQIADVVKIIVLWIFFIKKLFGIGIRRPALR